MDNIQFELGKMTEKEIADWLVHQNSPYGVLQNQGETLFGDRMFGWYVMEKFADEVEEGPFATEWLALYHVALATL